MLKILFSAYRHPTSEIEVYYKTLRIDDVTPFDDLGYARAELLTNVEPSSGYLDLREYEYNVEGIPEFVSIAIKIVFKGTDEANPQRVKDLRVIALAT